MAILLNNVGFENAPWREVFERELPQLPVFEYDQISDVNLIKYAAVWHHPYNDLDRYPNLKAIFLLGAGTDHIDKDPAIVRLNVPVVRLIDPDVGIDMAHYVLYWAMHFQRRYGKYAKQAKVQKWQRSMPPRIQDWRVTVLGLGRIGEFVIKQVSQVGFQAQAWNRSEKTISEVTTYFGAQGFKDALSRTDVLVNCLPLNDETHHLLNDESLTYLPNGAFFINISRGAVVDEQALLSALESNQLAGAALDCFSEEPLPSSSQFWQMENVYVTPHMSGATYARSAALVIVDNIKQLEVNR